jgi:hypothetical protein
LATRVFEVDDLLEAASSETGLSDYGPPHFREGLEVLVESLSYDSKLRADAVPKARAMIMAPLVRRLQVQHWRNEHPEVERERIEAPVCIIGSPRSGSSIMHELWSLDPSTRNPLAWEVRHPVPPPETATYTTDARIEQMRLEMGLTEASGDPKVPHRAGPTLPSEDVEITMLDFASVVPMVRYYVPTYTERLFEKVDFGPVYRTLTGFLRLLQSRCPGSPWVLKTLYSMHYIDAFLAEYPDARVIWLHRDPVTATASGAHLVQMASKPSSDDIDPVDYARDVARWSVVRHDLSVDIQEKGLIPPERLFNVRFHEFVKDHVGTVKAIYEHFGMELHPEVEATMRAYVGANPADTVRHDYTLRDCGLDPVEYRRKFARYQEYFGIPNDPGSD